ncbi:type VI secretion system baseplate subunit TssF [Frigidibacter sp. ROC022]|uniref:type VI secretion system baseplate subunit TssF n=1 Tax=Frigidibacter sp. ROC022 TaxID=2971796 RepID=UPI00215A3BA7|nr:type VI secretion system baseplate subunit TssF [Frigidibacter sp. ROC022]MCR8723329.1 type VI secretion system baseplate subunit TssF [Frigidibacter sp. ROC022]
MDTRLLRHYENELAFMRDMGGEFAAAYPKIAARLGMEGLEVLDPYVERLLEGVAFLSARVQLELELQYPAFTANLLEIIYPHYLAPTPSMMVAAFQPDVGNSAVKDGYVLERHTQLRARTVEGGQTACVFRTAADVTLWPIEISEVEYIDSRGGLVAAGVSRRTEARAGIRLRLKRTDGLKMAALSMDRLVVHLNSQAGNAWALHEMIAAESVGLVGRATDRRADWTLELPEGRVEQRGFEPEEALLPTPARSFDGYRLLQEYFAMPERFHFVELCGLQPALKKAPGSDVDIYILLKDGNRDIGEGLSVDSFLLHAVPAINLFPRRFDRAHVTTTDTEQHITVNRTAPLDYEIYSIDRVIGISGEGKEDVVFKPFYSASDLTAAGETHPAYYTIHRRMRQRSERERLRGVRTSYLGAEIYLSLVDGKQAPYGADITQLAVSGLCTNRDLPMLLATAGKDVFDLPEGGPVLSVSTPVAPTRPRPTMAQGDTAWRLISHLSLNYISIADNPEQGAEALRELIGIYAPVGDRVISKQLEGVVDISSRPIVRRMTDEVLSTAVRGLEITLTFDDSFFEGSSAYLLGSVLERFFRKHVTINSFTETVLRTQQRGEIARWRPAAGLGRMI